MSLLDDYKLLQLNTNATEQEAKSAYRHLANLYHPDKNPDHDTTEHFQSLHTAYQNVLASIKQGVVIQDWKKYDFTASDQASMDDIHSDMTSSHASDEIQRQYIKERQQAYEEMKRNTLSQERAREAALRRARNTINEKKAKEMYEQAFKSSNYANSTSENNLNTDQAEPDFGIDPSLFNSFENIIKEEQESKAKKHKKNEIDDRLLVPIKSALRAVSYIVTFALGIYTTLYWQDANNKQPEAFTDGKKTEFIAGLYPQYRGTTNHTIETTKLYAAPDTASSSISSIPPLNDIVVTNNSLPNWLAIRFQDKAGWVEESNIGFGSSEQARTLHCFGTPGVAPIHGSILDSLDILGKSRLRLINQLPTHSFLTFESYEGAAPFSIYLNARQSFAINYIPRGRYRLLLSTGNLFHNGCQQFLFNQDNRILTERIEFTGIEQTLTLE